jgi:hypothetical protein
LDTRYATMVDCSADGNGTDVNNGNRNGFNCFDCGKDEGYYVNLRGITHNNGRDGADNGLLDGDTARILYIDLQSYDNGEDGVACNGDEGGVGTTICSIIGAHLYNDTNDGTCVYEARTTQYVTNSVIHTSGDPVNGSAGCHGIVDTGSTVAFHGLNNICYRPHSSTRAFATCGCCGGTGTPTRDVQSSIYIPRTADSDAFAPGGITYDTAPGGWFTTFSHNKLGMASPNYDSPSLFVATSDTSYGMNNYHASAANTAAIDVGAPYCTVTSATGSGTSFNTSCDPRLYFYSNTNRPGVAADTAYIGTGSATCTVTSLTSSSISCTSSVSWTQNGTVARVRQVDAALDIGLFEFTGPQPPAPILESVVPVP